MRAHTHIRPYLKAKTEICRQCVKELNYTTAWGFSALSQKQTSPFHFQRLDLVPKVGLFDGIDIQSS